MVVDWYKLLLFLFRLIISFIIFLATFMIVAASLDPQTEFAGVVGFVAAIIVAIMANKLFDYIMFLKTRLR